MRLFERNSLSAKVASVGLSVALLCGGIPAPALAEALDQMTALSEEQPAEQGAELPESEPEPTQPTPDQAQGEDASQEAGEQPDEDSAGGGEADTTREESPQGVEEGAAEGQETEAETPAKADPNAGVVPEGKDEPSLAPAADLASDSYLMIQTAKDIDGYGNRVSGELSVGTVLWANMHDYDWDDAIPSSSGWAYQWYAGDSKSSALSSYQPIEGETSQGLTITKELSTELAGKYLVVTMTADGTTYTGPGFRGISASYVPGPVAAEGTVTLYNVQVSNTEPSVGDTITATANKSYGTPVSADTEVTYVWTVAGETEPVQQGTASSLMVSEAWQGKTITVSASAGANTVTATTSAVAAKGAVRLYEVTLDAPSATQVGATLTAHAYRGSYSSKTEVSEGVTFTWLVSDSKSYSATWTPIEGETGPTLTVPESCEGKYVRVQATAGGVNTVEVSTYNALGPFKQPGAYTIYAAYAYPNGQTTGNNAYTTEDTLWALARETSGGDFLPADGLTYQWLAGDTYNRNALGYEPLVGEESQTLSLSGLAGKYVAVRVASKIGSSSYVAAVTKAVAEPGAVNVTYVAVNPTGEVNPGDTIAATASSSEGNVTDNDRVRWSWWQSPSYSGTYVQIEGATQSSLTVTEEMMGSYLRAYADGGYGPISSTQAAGPVVARGAVNLYNVTLSGDAIVGHTLTAQANKTASSAVSAADAVTYVWEYATFKTTTDSAFAPIPGAPNSATFTIPQTASDGTSLVGAYIRVRAVSKDQVVSTYQRYSYYGTTSYRSVDPTGPVRLDGGYDLTSVKLSSSGQGAQVGAQLTPKAQYLYQGSYSSYETDVPSDARVTYVWHMSDADGAGDTILTEGVDKDGRLTLSDDLVERQVWCVAAALMTPATSERVTVRPADDFDLLRVQFSTPGNTSTTLSTGDAVAIDVYAKRPGVTYTGTTGTADRVTDRIGNGVSVQWSVGQSMDGPWVVLEGETAAHLTIPKRAADCYLRAVATSGEDEANAVEVVYPQKVVDADSLEGIVAQLARSDWRPEPVFGTDTNVNDMLREELERRGVDVQDIEITTSDVTFNSVRDGVTVGIGTGEQDNGDIAYLWADLDAMSYFYPTSYQQASITFTLERDGRSVSFSPARKTIIGWDKDKARAYLEQKAEALEIGYAAGDDASSVTDTLTLPNAVPSTSWAKVSAWESNNAAISVSGYSWSSSCTGSVTRGAADVPVSLVASIGFSGSSVPDVTIEKTYDLTVAADPDCVAEELAKLQEKLDNGFAYSKVTYFETGAAIDPQDIVADLQLPTTRALGVDGRDYQVVYSSSDDAVTPNGYRGAVVRPLPGSPACEVSLTCTITSKDNPQITASKTLTFVVSPVPSDDIDAELALLEEARASYLAGIINGNDPQSVTGNLHGFQKAYRGDDGSLVWAYSVGEASGHLGIVPVELPGYDAMGPSDQARLFASSAPQVIQHENLVLVDTPDYDTQVTVTSVLASERYGAYYERYKDDPRVSRSLLQKLAVLAGQDACATVTVKGTLGADGRTDDEKTYEVAVSFIGPNAAGTAATWCSTSIKVKDGDGTTAADVTRMALDENDLAYTFAGSVLEEIVSPATGKPIVNEENGAYWQLWINGSYSERYANGHYLSRGDTIVWQYAENSSVLDDNVPPLDPVIPSNPSDVSAEWSQSIEGGNVTQAATPTEGGEPLWQTSVRAGSSSVSEPLIISLDGRRMVVTFSGRNAYLTDSESGALVTASEVLGGNMSLTARPTFADGIIYVPLNGGRVQAIDASSMEPLWISDAIASTNHNATCSTRLFDVDGKSLVVVGTSEGNDARSGVVVALDATTGKMVWTAANDRAGYFWTDAVSSEGYLVMGDTAGTLHVFDPDTGREVASAQVSEAAINADLVKADGHLLVMDRSGVLRKVRVEQNGTLVVDAKVRVGQGSTAAPVVVGGKAICTTCGPVGDDSSSASVVIVDLDTLSVERTVTSAGGVALAGGIKGSALVSVQQGGTYCYVTTNDERGALYVYRLGDAEARLFYLPGNAQFCDSPVICDADGNLYYLNDSGVLVRLKAGSAPQASGGQAGGTAGAAEADKPKVETNTKSPLQIALRSSIALKSSSTARSSSGDKRKAAQSLLADIDSVLLESPVTVGASQGTGTASDTTDASEPVDGTRKLPIWPIVGMVCGALTLAVVALRRRDDEEE